MNAGRSHLVACIALCLTSCGDSSITREQIVLSPDDVTAFVILDVYHGSLDQAYWTYLSVQPKIPTGSDKLYELDHNIAKLEGHGTVLGKWTSDNELVVELSDALVPASGLPHPKTVDGISVAFRAIEEGQDPANKSWE